MNWAMESPNARSNKQAASELERQVREASASVANNEDGSETARQRLGDRPAARGPEDVLINCDNAADGSETAR